ncbi:MAG: hypothetical protein EA401_12735 [Planctomycetota bacterium]|nr:MAG: hypothetical protein EA401_12735 [Planctomycetota bacterium]
MKTLEHPISSADARDKLFAGSGYRQKIHLTLFQAQSEVFVNFLTILLTQVSFGDSPLLRTPRVVMLQCERC